MHVPDSDLAPDTVLPAQLVDAPLGGARIQPEKRLQVAVLADAVVSFRRWADVDEPRARRLFAEVEAWFASDDAAGPFAFVTICQSLGFDPAYIRRGLRRSQTGRVENYGLGMAAGLILILILYVVVIR